MRAGFASPRLIAKNGAASTRMSSTAGFVPRTSGLNKKFGTFSAWHGEQQDLRIGRKRRWRLISVRRFYPGLSPRIRDLAALTTCSGVKPSSRITISPGADAPKRSSPMIAPSRPT